MYRGAEGSGAPNDTIFYDGTNEGVHACTVPTGREHGNLGLRAYLGHCQRRVVYVVYKSVGGGGKWEK